jgi:hypothetical protein
MSVSAPQMTPTYDERANQPSHWNPGSPLRCDQGSVD